MTDGTPLNGKVLIVDDNTINVQMLVDILEGSQYEVGTAFRGQEALSKLRETPYDVVLLDVMMPEMSGYEVLDIIRADKSINLTSVVLVTALNSTEERIKGITAGCDDFISKPFDPNEILARIQTLIKLNYYRNQVAEKEKFENLIQPIDHCVVVLDKDLNLTWFNQAASAKLGLSPDAFSNPLIPLLETHFSTTIDPDTVTQLSRGDCKFDLQRTENAHHQPIIFEATSHAIINPANDVDSIVISFQDVTTDRLSHFQKMTFLSFISHKLRTPLTILMQAVGVFQSRMTDANSLQDRQMLTILSDKTIELQDHVDRLITYSDLVMRGDQLPKVDIPIKQILVQVVDDIMNSFKQKQINITYDCTDNCHIHGVKEHFIVILYQLLENAIKFNDKDQIEISLNVTPEDDMIRLKVQDNGHGIPTEIREAIFDPFFQEDKLGTGNVMGLGLGLSIVQKLIQAQNGRVEISDGDAGGSVITLWFPMVKAPELSLVN